MVGSTGFQKQLNIVYLMPESYPFGEAYASRVRGFSKALIDKGHRVVVFCDYPSSPKLQCSEYEGVYEGQHYYYTAEKRTQLDRFFIGRKTVDHFYEYLKENHVDIVITSSSYDRISYLNKRMQGTQIPVILESCEKYHYSNWRLGRFDYRYFQFQHCWKREYPKASAVIAISRYLSDYYKSLGKDVLLVPTILDVDALAYSANTIDPNILNFVFAGTLGGGKDSVAEFIKAMSMLDNEKKSRVRLNIYGPTEQQVMEQLKQIGGFPQDVQNNVTIYGRVPQENIPGILASNDFSLLLRPNRESSNAGFPTKLAESMSAGTPVFGNDTGDVGLYLSHGKNGILLRDNGVNEIVRGLKYVLNLSEHERGNMRMEARKTAEKSFSYKSYKESIEQFLLSVKKE